MDKLIRLSRRWDTEQHKYICLQYSGNVCFTNNIDCDGARYWNKKAFKKQFGSMQ